jgi:DNA helicase-2/ATP-dependent DNA helicase PcrA
MKDSELRDYDDMIIEVIDALKKYPDLSLDIGEEYQYILVDEFQDTNDAQFRIIEEITKNEIYDKRPNILCVGDDDQGIYKFQGAESSNILRFINDYKDVKKIILDENYRSHQDILDIGKGVIYFASDRLVNKDKSIIKDLRSKNEEIIKSKSEIEVIKAIDDITEFSFVADKIKNLIDSGTKEKDIAIIARK